MITRVVDYGGVFFDDLRPGQELVHGDHRAFRPAGWLEAGLGADRGMRPIAERAGLTMMQLACQWNLAHQPVQCVAPTLIQEAGPQAKSIEDKRAELAALPAEQRLTNADVDTIRTLGDNTGCMALKGASRNTPARNSPTAGLDETWPPWPNGGASTPTVTLSWRTRHERVRDQPPHHRRLQLRRRPLRGQRAVRRLDVLPLHASRRQPTPPGPASWYRPCIRGTLDGPEQRTQRTFRMSRPASSLLGTRSVRTNDMAFVVARSR